MRNPFRSKAPAWGVTDEQPKAEERAIGNWVGSIGGHSVIDPSAIPPHGIGMNNWAGVQINYNTMLMSDAVMTALRIISNGILELGDGLAYKIQQDDSNYPYKVFLPNQPTFLSNTFGDQWQYIGIETTIFSMGLWGSAWWYVIERDRLQYPSAVEVLNPALLEIKVDRDGTVKYFYGMGLQRKELDKSKLIHIPHKILPGALQGLSSMDFAGVSVAIALAATEFASRYFSQSISPGYMLTTDAKLGQDEVQRILQQIMVQHAGLSQAHIPMIIDSGLKPERGQSTPDDAGLLQTLEYCRSVVGAYFGIPSSLLGNALLRQTPPPAHTIGEEMQRMVTWTLSGYIRALEEAYSNLLPGRTKVMFDRSRILQSDAQSFAALVNTLVNSNVVTSNELRTRYLNLEPHPDGDELITPLASNTAPGETNLPVGEKPQASKANPASE